MNSLATLYFAIAVAIWTVVAVVAFRTALADAIGVVVAVAALAVVARVVIELTADQGDEPRRTR